MNSEDNGVETKAPGKILIPHPKVERKANHSQRKHTRDVVSKMLKHASAYIVVMWNKSDYEEPVAVMDLSLLAGKDNIVSKSMGKIAQHTSAVMRYCQENMRMTTAQREQAERVAQVKEQRSKDLAGDAGDVEGTPEA